MSKKTRTWLVFYAILSLLLLSIGIVTRFFFDAPWTSGFIGAGVGGGLAAAVWYAYIQLFPKKAKETERQRDDERGKRLAGKAALTTQYVIWVLLFIAMAVFEILGFHEISLAFWTIVLFQILVFSILFFFYRRKL